MNGQLEHWIEHLGNEAWDMRIAACTELGRLGDKRAVPPLIERLADEAWDVRIAASTALGRLGDKRAVPPLIGQLGTEVWDIRNAAGAALAQLGEGRLAAAVLGALSGKKEAMEAVGHLASEGDVRAVSSLVSVLSHREMDEKAAARKTLARAFNKVKRQAGSLLCGDHFTRFEKKKVEGSPGMHYFACRHCGETVHAVLGHEIVAVLDCSMSDRFRSNRVTARVNWLQRQTLFDFDRVEIVQASIKEVERFCIEVRNDGDASRAQRYRSMRCTVARACNLPELTMRTLHRIFGEVIVD